MTSQPTPLALESLEARRLLSASFASVNSHGTLSVIGTSSADMITVQTSGSKVQAILNGATESFTASTVKRIWIEAFGGNDKITNKTSLQSTLIGDSGNDTIVGGSANDTIQAGSGDDHFDGGLGVNSIDEGSGNDEFDYSAETGSKFYLNDDADYSVFDVAATAVFRNGSAGEDLAISQSSLHTFLATPGNDDVSFFLNGAGKPKFDIYGGDGNDTLATDDEGQAMLIDGGNGNDTIFFSYDTPPVSVLGEAGDDLIEDSSGYGTVYINGGSGNDTDMVDPDEPAFGEKTREVTIPDGIETYTDGSQYNFIVNGNDLNNIINVNAANVTVYGNGGDDQITATSNSDDPYDTADGHLFLDGGSGNDLLHGTTTQNSTLKGDSGNDTLIGDAGYDSVDERPALPIYTYEGDSGTDTADFSDQTANLTLHIDGQPDSGAAGQKDLITGDVENIIGGSGNDLITGNPSNNSLEGGTGNDTIWGSSGNDTLVGDAGHDQLYGQDGNDVLYGKDGQTDTLDGGDGTDKASRDDSSAVKDQVLSIESFI